MEESERPNKIRKLSHAEHNEAAIEALTIPGNISEDNITHDSSSVTVQNIPNGGATNDTASALDSAADSISKTLEHDDSVPNTSAPLADITLGTTDLDKTSTSTSAEPTTTKKPRPIVLDPETGLPISRNQQKKLKRQQEWDLKKDDRRIERKEKLKAKRERQRAARDAAGPEAAHDAWKEKQRAYVPAIQLPIALVLDCDFDDKMRDNERVSLAGQITRSYSENKNAKYRAHLAISSFQGKLRQRFDGVLAKNYTHWKGTHFLDEDFVAAAEQAKMWMADETHGGKLESVFEKYASNEETVTKAKEEGEVIYLSSDSEYTLAELKPYTTYVIGGLVDKNREKGICHRRAVEQGIKTARLPIGEYLDMASRKVLATNHVVEIMLKWLEVGDWGEAFMRVIPKRKGGMLKGQKSESEMGDEHEYGDDVAGEVDVEDELEADNAEDMPAEESKMEDVKVEA